MNKIIIVELDVVLEKCELIGEHVSSPKYWTVINTIRYWTVETYIELKLIWFFICVCDLCYLFG